MAARTVSAQSMSANWLTAMQSGTTQNKWKAGIQRVTTSPMAMAATPEATAKYLQGVQDSINNGRRMAGLNKGTLQSWQNAAISKVDRLSSGALSSKSKYDAFANEWAGTYTAASQAAASAVGALEKVRASINVLKQKAGKTPI